MTDTTSTEDKVLEALRSGSGTTVAELAEAAGLGRSTAGKALQLLVEAGHVRRTEGGRDGGRRLPDRFEVVAPTAATASENARAEGGASARRLGSGELRALVLADLAARGEPISPTAIAKALGRSGGAVSNLCGSSVSSTTVEEIAGAVGISRSATSRALVDLEREGHVGRARGGVEGGRRRPDRWSVVAGDLDVMAAESKGRLGRGELQEIVLEHLRAHPGESSPARLSKVLGHSAGAIGNVLAKLAAGTEVVQTCERPRRYAARRVG